MKKQTMSEAMPASASNITEQLAYNGRNQVKGRNQTIIQTTAIHLVLHTIYKQIQASYLSTQAWMVKLADSYLNEQIMLADKIIRENSRVYLYNFLGSPQALFLLPDDYKEWRTRNSLPANKDEIQPLSSVVSVLPLDKHHYELQISGNTTDLRVNIYDEAEVLILSEQITRKGYFSRMYDVKWAKAAAISFEVVSDNAIFRSGQL